LGRKKKLLVLCGYFIFFQNHEFYFFNISQSNNQWFQFLHKNQNKKAYSILVFPHCDFSKACEEAIQ